MPLATWACALVERTNGISLSRKASMRGRMVPARFAYFLRIRTESKRLFVADPSSCTGTDSWLALSHWRGFFGALPRPAAACCRTDIASTSEAVQQ